MHIGRWPFAVAFAAALTLYGQEDALACSCASPGAPCQNAFQVDAVFAGTVRSITPLPDDLPPPGPGEAREPRMLRVTFDSVEGFTGASTAVMSVDTPGSGPACGYRFAVGERYLVYANASRDRSAGALMTTGICSRTRPIAQADEDLRFLRSLPTFNSTGARLYGSVMHAEPNLGVGEIATPVPVANVLVAARGPGVAFETQTDSTGRYELRVPPGSYEVTAFPPPLFSTRYLRQQVSLRSTAACHAVDFGIRFDGRISGRLRTPGGETLDGLSVEAIPVERLGGKGIVESLHAPVDAGGHFEFIEVPPGLYVVGLDVVRRVPSGLVFPTTFYPGTPDPAAASVITLGGGERRELDALTLPPPRQSRKLEGVVVFADGSPVAGALILLSDGRETWREAAAPVKTETDGSFTFTVHDGLSYVAKAWFRDETNRRQLEGASAPFVSSSDLQPLRVVLAPR